MAIFSQKTIKMVWGRAAGRCSMPDCRVQLFLDRTETDDEALIGEIAHIVGEKTDAARGVSEMGLAQRNVFGNLILLCGHHHDIIDQQPGTWPVDRLHDVKGQHEAWVASSLSSDDKEREKQLERYAQFVDEWCDLVDIDHWTGWTSHMLGNGQPSCYDEILQKLRGVPDWNLTRLWPGTLLSLEAAFSNFARVVNDLTNLFLAHAKQRGDVWWTEKFYQTENWDASYDKRAKKFDYHVDLVQDLVLEMTRAANLVCDRVRETLLANFRSTEGRLVVEMGPNSKLQFVKELVQYGAEERAESRPYPGLTQFKADRKDRDIHFGTGDGAGG